MKADGSLKSLLQGVSQQPIRDRLPGQCTEQINMSADPVRGLTRRPGDDLVAKLGALTPAVGWGEFSTQDGREFVCKLTATGPKIFDYSGLEYVVNQTGAGTYWSTPGRFSFATLKEKTYIANSGVITALRSEVSTYYNRGTGKPTAGLIQVLGGQFAKRYTIILDGTIVAAFTTRNGAEAGHSEYVRTTFIAKALAWLLTHTSGTSTVPAALNPGMIDPVFTGAMSGAGWVVTRVEDIISVKRTSGAMFKLTSSDDMANVNLKVMTDNVGDIADLSRWAPHNYVARISQETDPEEDLWVKFVSETAGATEGSNFGQPGAWYEAVAPGLQIGFDLATMPRVLTFDTVTEEFTLGQGDWADRTVGTDITNPVPSFIGYGINDMVAFQNRLVLLAGAYSIGSRSKKYENFWLGSASTLADSDPIDLTSQAAFATTLEFAIPHNKDLVIFSPKGQFVMFGRTAVTPSNAALVLTTSFEAELTARPVPCGRNVFFSTKYGRFTGVREFYTEGGTDINDTRPITQHVNQYIIGSPVKMTASSNYDTLLVQTDADRRIMYPYQFIWADQEKIQSAWSKWTFPLDVVHSFFDDELIYYVQEVDGEHYLIRMSLDVYPEDTLDYHIHLSNRFNVSTVNTQFVLPFDWMGTRDLVVVQAEGCPHPGLPVRIDSVAYSALEGGFVVTLRNDMLGGEVVGGIPFYSGYIPTMPRMKDADGVPISNARLQINQIIASLETTGHIVGQKLTKWGNGPEVEFDGYVANSPSSLVGAPALDNFLFKMPFKERADRGEIQFFTAKHWPMTILDIEWEGTVNKRGKRLAQGDK